ncbi:MAG: tRNA (adenosine(37)-N6)-threonylcarbamoyltransferase complex dimerization subunit type 1 TsaB [Bacteroidota bacterium]
MTVLGIETATAVCAAAVIDQGRVLAEASLEEKNVHAERLLTQIDRVLHDAGTPLRSLNGIAVSIGPGSFTGLRIGLSVAKGLAYAASVPLIAVPTLEALARHAAAVAAPQGEMWVLAAIDARRDEVYCQLFAHGEGGCTPLRPVRDMGVAEVRAELAGHDVLVAGDGAMKVVGDPGPEGLLFAGTEASRCSAAAVARLGSELLASGRRDDPASLEPQYIKEFFLRTR